ncbi:MAG: NAD(+)/NADH kinase [Prevotellaceae bacterium]|jgi:NAD+ kinase|nr:NAD(+)/NADH kinase [Prevotellaceae bacterium]
MKIAIYSRYGNPKQEGGVIQIIDKIREYAEILVYEPFYRNLSPRFSLHLEAGELFNSAASLTSDVVCMFSVGGDGTLLEAASLVMNNEMPLVGISTGRLGFLAAIMMADVDKALELILSKNFEVEYRDLLQVDGCPGGPHFALNDVCIQKRGAAIAEIKAYINDEFLSTYWADGLIISTPTGSTAYSLSAGGPIIAPNARCLVLSPIAPHNLNMRPIVVPDVAKLELEMHTRTGSVIVGVDSKSFELPVSAKLKVQKARQKVGFVKLPHMSFYQTLREKLLWGLDSRG